MAWHWTVHEAFSQSQASHFSEDRDRVAETLQVNG